MVYSKTIPQENRRQQEAEIITQEEGLGSIYARKMVSYLILRIDKEGGIQKDVPGQKANEKRNYSEAFRLMTYYDKDMRWKTNMTYW